MAEYTGTDGNDTYEGTEGADTINGLGGNDILRGFGGDDIIDGGSGDDVLEGGDGNDRLVGGLGVDMLRGGGGNDHFQVLAPNELQAGDTFDGGSGDDVITVAGGGNLPPQTYDFSQATLLGIEEMFNGGTLVILSPEQLATDNFSVYGLLQISHGGDVILGNGTFWNVQLSTSGNRLDASAATDSNILIVGSDSVDDITGSAGSDQLRGAAGADRLVGGDGDDILVGGLGADMLIGGNGVDTASYNETNVFGAVFINLALGRSYGNAAEGDTLVGIENVTGGPNNDTIIGDGQNNRLLGGEGDDILLGALGADVLIGSLGTDTASYEDNQGSVFVDLLRGAGFNNAAQGDTFQSIENLAGSIYADYFIGSNIANRLDGGDGNDTLLGALGADVIVGGNGIDTASFEDNQGAVFVNLALGKGFGNAAEGDTYESIENLVGTVFYDTFIGDANANRLDGARGADTLTGGGGADVFAFTTALDGVINVDTITDFVSGADRIELAKSVFAALGTGTLSTAAFATGTAATTADQRILYDATSGTLRYDADGSGAGAATIFAVLENKPATIAAGDFFVV